MFRTTSHAQMRDFFAILFIVMATGALVAATIKPDWNLAILANVGLGSALGAALQLN
jgi:hypothetical protein